MTDERKDWISRTEILRELDAHQSKMDFLLRKEGGDPRAVETNFPIETLVRHAERELASLERALRNLKGQRRHTPKQIKNERRIQIWRTVVALLHLLEEHGSITRAITMEDAK